MSGLLAVGRPAPGPEGSLGVLCPRGGKYHRVPHLFSRVLELLLMSRRKTLG